ncbi:MAG: sugar phosphate nucleotidyltransferase [Candidatus Poribacteria bacterium]
MKGVIMAGGFGERMRPLTCSIPKPMAPIVNKPVMVYIVELLKKHGITDIISLLYYQPEIIQGYFKDGSDFGVNMSYAIDEGEGFGTAGSVKNAEWFLDEEFIIISGDLMTDFNLTRIIEFHKQKRAKVTIGLTRVQNPLSFGIVITDEEGKIVRFLEKPTWGEVFSDTINTGVYIMDPSVLDYIPPKTEFDFSKDVFPALMSNSEPLYGYIATGYWRDIGNIGAYHEVHRDILNGRVDVNISGKRQETVGKDIWLDEGAQVDSSSILEGTVVIGKNCYIGADAVLTNSVVGDNSTVEEGASITDSILWDKVLIGQQAEVKRSVICNHSTIKPYAILDEDAVISDNCIVGMRSRITRGVKMWPYKEVEDGATLNTSLVWGEKWSKSLFGSYGVTGLAGKEITPEFAAKLGAVYGAMLPVGSCVSAGRDSHRASRMVNRALISGIVSVGINVHNFEDIPAPVVRYATGAYGDLGGFHVRQAAHNPEILDIRFFDPDGMDIPISKERAIERLFFKEDFRRVGVDEVGTIEFPPRIVEYYHEGFRNFIDGDTIRAKGFKIVIDYAYGSASTILPSIMGELGCEIISLNTSIGEMRLTRTQQDFENSLQELSNIVITLQADAGFMLDTSAERLFIVDESGDILMEDDTLAILAMLVLKSAKGGKIAVPVTASRIIDGMAEEYGAEVIRTKTSIRSMMEVAASQDISFVGGTKNGYIFPQFHPVFDAMGALMKTLEMMAQGDARLGELKKLCPTSAMVREHVSCPWELKGTVMRNVIEEAKDEKTELIDGVKIHFDNDDWVLILPDMSRPIFHVNAESDSMPKAHDLADKYIGLIRKIIDENSKGWGLRFFGT